MKQREFDDGVVPLLEAIFEANGKPLPSNSVKAIWYGALKHYDSVTVLQALNAHVSRAAATYGIVQPNDIVLLIEGSPEDRAVHAWQTFLSAARSKSPYLSIAFDDPCIHATVKHMGGWVKLTGEMTEDARELDLYRRTFETAYKGFLRTGLPADTPERLPGVVENHRILNGLKYEEPVQLVGRVPAAVERLPAAARPKPASLAAPGDG